ncbi:hypothetical protein CEP51_012014 [Fusarium floridanum]|uniref:Uncharacterized protein n=1 Tax=Fusarium floridanum TaxID=1325733 RepID=A0A428R2D3_9HYPO|nr:hypothetical protein CEP51_012014 [Fusarium floridanum]
MHVDSGYKSKKWFTSLASLYSLKRTTITSQPNRGALRTEPPGPKAGIHIHAQVPSNLGPWPLGAGLNETPP